METSYNTEWVGIKDEMSRTDLLNSPRLQTLVLDALRSAAEDDPHREIRYQLVIHPEPEQ